MHTHKIISIAVIYFTVISIFFFNSEVVRSEIYEWTDSQGIKHFSDSPPNKKEYDVNVRKENRDSRSASPRPRQVPFPVGQEDPKNPINLNVKDKGTYANKYDPRYIKAVEIYNSAFAQDAELSDRVKSHLSLILTTDILSANDIRNIKTDEDGIAVFEYVQTLKNVSRFEILTVFGPPDPRFSSPESTWNTYNNARKSYDLKTALDCITPAKREKLNKIFSVIKKEDLIELANNTISFERSEVNSNNRVTYIKKSKDKGEIFAYDIVFVRIFGNWKIEEF